MCGISGVYKLRGDIPVCMKSVQNMTRALEHRGPDDISFFDAGQCSFGFTRLSIIDLKNGKQPFHSSDSQVSLICNGEIYNYRELRSQLTAKGYSFNTNNDIEVLIPLYLEYGIDFLKKLNGQFAIALFDNRRKTLLLARDHFGICPLFYRRTNDQIVFASEIKGILAFTGEAPELNAEGLDHVFSFPSVIHPVTMFKGIVNIPPGHFMLAQGDDVQITEYWDLNYPTETGEELQHRSEEYYAEAIEDLLIQSIKYRMAADVPVAFYLSGGLDSTVIGALMKKIEPDLRLSSFSIGFDSGDHKEINETHFQQLAAGAINSKHHELIFQWSDFYRDFRDTLYHAEVPMKESYNVCSFALSRLVQKNNFKVVLSGEGADEIFGGYAGYKFDQLSLSPETSGSMEEIFNEDIRKKLWGDGRFAYEASEYETMDLKRSVYSDKLKTLLNDFNCYDSSIIDKSRIAGRGKFEQRSYVDLKLRLAAHLLADHGDRMTYAHGVEGRYPYLDVRIAEFMRTVPAKLKLKDLTEKYILKKVARNLIPPSIVRREKFGFVAPASHHLLKRKEAWVEDYLSYEKIKNDGYFNPDHIEQIKKVSRTNGFQINPSFENDVLMIVLSFNILKDIFNIKPL